MNLFKNQTASSVVKIIVAILLGLLVLFVSSMIMQIGGIQTLMQSKFWLGGFINHALMLIISLALILTLNKGRLSTYGFRITENFRLKQTIIVGFIAGLFITGLASMLPIDTPESWERFSFLQLVIFIWIWASVCEEVLTRGLIQGYLSSLSQYGPSLFKLRISLPVFISALFFGFMHLGLLMTGLDGFSVVMIASSAFLLGLVAGHYREKTESIIPAIIIHMLFNISGSITGLIKSLI